MSDGRPEPAQFTPSEAVERYLQRRQADATKSSVYSWQYRLKLFVEWCGDQGIETIGDLRGYDLDRYFEHRAATTAPATLEGEMFTLQKFVRYLDDVLGAVEDGLADAVQIPDVAPEDRTDDTMLAQEDALALLAYYRNSDQRFASRAHALLELAWLTGARQGGLRSLDVRDLHVEECYVDFRHRPNTGTGLKNKGRGERAVAIPPSTAAMLEEYVEEHRHDVYDEHNRQPLLASMEGRPTGNTFRNWTYQATQPCLHSPCPHGKERVACSFTKLNQGSKCPSSRSPHQIRTGSIGWQLDQELPAEIVAERVNASVRTIREHYDKIGRVERMERRRRHYISDLEFDL